MPIAYLGPDGTFTQQAALLLNPGSALQPFTAICDIFEAVSNGAPEAGVVPFENSTEGAVNETLDALLFDYSLSITAQLSLPISHCLMTRRETRPNTIKKIISHPQSLAQCRYYLRKHYPNTPVQPVDSNGFAAKTIAESGEPWAAVGPRIAAEHYGLCVCDENIQDHPNNFTSFIQIENEPQTRPRKGCRASVAFSTYNKPGELYRMLSVFDVYRVNMTKILSRPLKNAPGEYVFFIDIEDCVPRDAVRALSLIKERTPFYRFLGSYPVRTVTN